MKERILIVDDEDSSRELCRMALEDSNRDLILCANAQEALTELRKDAFDLVLTDMVMPGLSGLELLEKIKSERSETPVLLMSGKGSIASAVKAIKLGAEDFIEKPFPDPEVVVLAVKRSLRARRLEQENRELRQELQKLRPHPHIIGGEAIAEVLRIVERIAPLDATVLVTGETGTGKELIARRLHVLSPRAGRPFVAINCGGLPEGILESLLFGHERGAFTGAVRRASGFFEKANGGSVFLDEIGDMPINLQVKLLRVLQEKSFQRVGGDHLIEVDCRVIASTHRDLRQMVADGTFREDLYYRLNVLRLHVPPLRERIQDIPDLVRHFMRQSSARLEKSVRTITDDALKCLKTHPWPGNVRELENVIERLVALCNGQQIDVEDLPSDICRSGPKSEKMRQMKLYNQAKEEFERQYILAALADHNGNVSAAAEATGIPRQNFYMKMKKLGIKLNRSDRKAKPNKSLA